MVQAYFKNIHREIINELNSSRENIRICVAWFTDYDIYKTIVERQKNGVNVDVIVANHEFNKKSRVDFKELLKHNGKVSYIGKLTDGAKDKFMHNKFCIIDESTLITGSYNWSFKARSNDENILVIKKEKGLVNQFMEKFQEIKPQFGFAIKGNTVELLPIQKIMAKWEKSKSEEVKNSKAKPSKAKTNSIFNKF